MSIIFVVSANVVILTIKIHDYNFNCYYSNCVIINDQFVLSYHSLDVISMVTIKARMQFVSIMFDAINIITTCTTMNLLMKMIVLNGTRFTMKQSNSTMKSVVIVRIFEQSR